MEEVIRKLKFRGIGVIINAPENLVNGFVEKGYKTAFDDNEKSTDTLLFIKDHSEWLTFQTNS